MCLYQGRSKTQEALLHEGWSSQVHLHICILFKTGKETAVLGAKICSISIKFRVSMPGLEKGSYISGREKTKYSGLLQTH